ncbi:hypothetical protein [Dysgonomonas sp. 25]|uniref:hypothetical protein n=1 Tax=Dysgonomonas sp. 25 TaxID=2302933 RepID=UPI0013D3F165|nr:hypothetical protein [Dysgonomonas sp. 25]NDV69068.1 hypothetical protein [Dysgonomonas sp. 25]
MALKNLQIEKVIIPKDYEEVILSENREKLTNEQKLQGFTRGHHHNYWRMPSDEGIVLSIAPTENKKGEKYLKYEVMIHANDNFFGELEKYIEDSIAEDGYTKRKKNFWWAHYLSKRIGQIDEALYNSYSFGVNAPSADGYMTAHLDVDNLKEYKKLLKYIAQILRGLHALKVEEERGIYRAAVENKNKITDYIDSIRQHRAEAEKYPKLWEEAGKVLERWPLSTQNGTVELLALICSIPRRDSKKELQKLTHKLAIKEKLAKNHSLRAELFFALQQQIGDYYLANSNGFPTKPLVTKVAKILALALEAFGFGIYPDGLVTLIRVFSNDAAEGISLEWYQEDPVYDAEEFGYYDGIENENYLDVFWEKIDIEELIR